MTRAWREGDAFRLLTDLAEVPGETTDVASAARRIQAVIQKLGVEFSGVYLADASGDLARIVGTVSDAPARIPGSLPIIARVRETLASLHVPVAEHPCEEAATELARRGVRAIAIVPLLLGERFTGVLTASRANDDGGLGDLPDGLLLAIGRVASVALDQAKLLAAARARAERDRLLLEAARFAGSSLDLDAALEKYAAVLSATAQARRSTIALRDPDAPGFFRPRTIFGQPGEDTEDMRALPIREIGMVKVATTTKRPHIYAAKDITTPVVREYFESRGDTYFVALPLVARDAVLGMAFVSRSTPIDSETSMLLEAVGHEIAATVSSAAERETARHAAEREQLEARLRAALRDSFDLGTILTNAVESLGRLLRVDRAQILLPHPERPGFLRLTYCWRSHPGIPDPTGSIFSNVSVVRPEDTTAALVVHDFDNDPRMADQPDLRPSAGAAYAFVRFDRSFERGGLGVCMAHTPRRWTDDEVKSIAAVAEHCQIAIARAELYENWRRRADELELTVASMADGVVLVNERLDIVRMNPAARTLLWQRSEAPPGSVDAWNPHVTVLDWEGRLIPQEQWPIVRAVMHGEAAHAMEVVFRFNDTGRERFVVVNASPLGDRDGRPRGGVIVLRDVTEQRAAKASAERTEKLRVVGELAASVAHDLNNTLAAVLGRAEMISTSTEIPGTRADAELIAQAARDASVVLGRLTRLSQKGHATASRAQVDLAVVAGDAVELTRPRWALDAARAGRKIAVQVMAESGVIVRGVATELREVVTNLILNSVDALPSGGTVSVRVGRASGLAFFEVEDDGVGMPPEVLRHACEPFFTTKGDLGTGLGLSISSAIVAGHGGKLDLRSTPGSGTAIRAWLPLAEDDPTPRGPVNVSKAPRRVLVVDDDPRVRSVLADLLRSEGHEVEIAGSGEEALESIEQATHPPDLVVTDVAMPGMSGWVLAEEVRKHHQRVAIVLVSGWSASASREEMAALRATFVMKPFRVQEFQQAVAVAMQLAVRPE